MQNTSYSLSQYEFIRIRGADAISFLQGQVSCNTELLTAKRSLPGALCNLKGRVIADFRLVEIGQDCILQCAEGMAGTILATLSKYAVFSKVELQRLEPDASTTPRALGLIGESVDSALARLQLPLPESSDSVSPGEACSVIRLPGPARRIEVWFHNEAAMNAFLTGAEFELSSELDPWLRAEIAAGMIHVTPPLSEEYTPQLLSYDISGLIDFKKGCYTGQEIVARMFYRGTAKKRLYLASADDQVSAESRVVTGTELESGSAGGEILAFSNSEAPTLLMAVLASESIEAGESFQLSDRAGSEVRVQSLPYNEIVGKVAGGG